MWSLDLLHALSRLLHPTAERHFDCFFDAPFKRSVLLGLAVVLVDVSVSMRIGLIVILLQETVLMHRYFTHKCQCLLNDGIITVLLYASLYHITNKEGDVANMT